MGHAYSRHNADSNHYKRYESNSTILGYSKSSTTSIYIKQEDKNSTHKTDEDGLLLNPHLYGLADTDSTASNSNKDRLRRDIMYVNQTYYASSAPAEDAEKKKPHLLIKKDTKKTGKPIRFRDIPKDSWEQEQIILSRCHLYHLSSHIGYLAMIRKLDLSHNQLKELPVEVGYLSQLEVLCLAHNQLQAIPDTIGYLTQLVDLNLTWNQLGHLTPFIGQLKQLKYLYLGHNQLKDLSGSIIRNLTNLALLDLSYNSAIHILPAEITHLPYLRRLRLDGCSFDEDKELVNTTVHSPPSLFDSCARDLLLSLLAQTTSASQHPLLLELKQHNPAWVNHLLTVQICSHCRGPYFGTYITRYRWVERNDLYIPLEYRLCSAHWSDEETDRLYAMFSSPSNTRHTHQAIRKKSQKQQQQQQQQHSVADMNSIISALGLVPDLPNLPPLTTNIADRPQTSPMNAAATVYHKQTCNINTKTRRSRSANNNSNIVAMNEQEQQQHLEEHQQQHSSGSLRVHHNNTNNSILLNHNIPSSVLTTYPTPLHAALTESDATSTTTTTATSTSSSSPVKNRWQRFLKVRNCSSFMHKYH